MVYQKTLYMQPLNFPLNDTIALVPLIRRTGYKSSENPRFLESKACPKGPPKGGVWLAANQRPESNTSTWTSLCLSRRISLRG